MTKSIIGPEIKNLIHLLSQIPGFGPRSAQRAALYLINNKKDLMQPLNLALQNVIEKVQVCSICGNIDTANPCSICQDIERNAKILIVVEDVASLWALERTSYLKTYYHVLGGRLSPLDGIGPQQLNIASLKRRAEQGEIEEIILAVNATFNGETTVYYIIDLLASLPIKVTRLAHGVPIGGELDYLDEGTLSQALRARTKL